MWHPHPLCIRCASLFEMAPKQSKFSKMTLAETTNADGETISGDDYILQIILAEDLEKALADIPSSSAGMDVVLNHLKVLREKIDKAAAAVKKMEKETRNEGREKAKREKGLARRETIKAENKEKRNQMLELDIDFKKNTCPLEIVEITYKYIQNFLKSCSLHLYTSFAIFCNPASQYSKSKK